MTDASAAPPALTPHLADIAARYDALLVDVWGVLHNGREAFQDAAEACRRFRAERGPVVLISNAPAPARFVTRVFERLQLAQDFFDGVVTSGDAIHAELKARAPGPAFKLGPDWDDRLYEDTGLAFASFDDAAFISCTGLFEDERESPDDYAEMLAAAKAREMELVCANPDIVVQRGDRLIYCGGALAEAYAKLGGRVVYAGKPHAPIYALGYAALAQAAGQAPARERILAIGDGLDTDILGAMNEGLDALFVARGVHAEELAGAGDLDPDALAALMARRGRRAAYAAHALAW